MFALQNCTVLYLTGFPTNITPSVFMLKLRADVLVLLLRDVSWCVERTARDVALLELSERSNLGKRFSASEA